MDGVPAYLVGRRQDVIGWNRLAAEVFGDFGALPAAERNLVRLVFLDPATAELYADWECRACEVVSNLRMCSRGTRRTSSCPRWSASCR